MIGRIRTHSVKGSFVGGCKQVAAIAAILATLAGGPATSQPATNAQNDFASKGTVYMKGVGLRVAALTDSLRERYNIHSSINGVIIIDIDPNSEAAAKGLEVGNVIVQVGWEPVATPADLEEKLNRLYQDGLRSASFLVVTAVGKKRLTAVLFTAAPPPATSPEQKLVSLYILYLSMQKCAEVLKLQEASDAKNDLKALATNRELSYSQEQIEKMWSTAVARFQKVESEAPQDKNVILPQCVRASRLIADDIGSGKYEQVPRQTPTLRKKDF